MVIVPPTSSIAPVVIVVLLAVVLIGIVALYMYRSGKRLGLNGWVQLPTSELQEPFLVDSDKEDV